jgi:Protein of unknown function (DUF3048) N-terminal domain/Protein of unknown function (DUF3048) C-terminal domain
VRAIRQGRHIVVRPGAMTAIAVSIAVVVSGCGPQVPMPTPTPSPKYTSSYQTPAPEVIAPLRGTTVDASVLTHPSLAAKVDNLNVARPQVGLERTDIVFEELVEGGLTRYVAIWDSDIPEEIGPVRSIRPMDPDIISSFHGIVAYSGGQQRFVQLMLHTPVLNAIHGQASTADTFFRTKAKTAPHNVIVRAAKLVRQHRKLAPPAQQFAYSLDKLSSSAVKDGKPVTALALAFSPVSKPSWKYDAVNSWYLRSQGGVRDFDGHHHQLHADNVIVIRVVIDTRLGVPKTHMIGDGVAWVSTGGSTIHARWSKSMATRAIRLVDDNGVVIRLAPGNTWIELVPVGGQANFR